MNIQRRSTIFFLIALILGGAGGLAFSLSFESNTAMTRLIVIASLLVTSIFGLYLLGLETTRELSIIATTLLIGLGMPEPFVTERFAVAVLIPPVTALIMGGPWSVLLSGSTTYIALLIRAGGEGVYGSALGALSTFFIIGGMSLARLITDNARRAVEEQAKLIEQQRADLVVRVEERTRELRESNALLQRANQVKDALLANFSHELRTPLNVIATSVDLLNDGLYGELNERQHDALNRVRQSSEQLQELIENVLDLARLEANEVALEFGTVIVQELCDNCLRHIAPAVSRRGQHVQLRITTPHSTFQGDAKRVRQVLLKLLENAVKFTPDQGVIGLEAHSVTDQIVFEVWDTGIGIEPEQLERLFTAFRQVDSGLGRRYDGTGAGLALAHHLVRLHGGTLTATSVPGRGSRFRVQLPRGPVALP